MIKDIKKINFDIVPWGQCEQGNDFIVLKGYWNHGYFLRKIVLSPQKRFMLPTGLMFIT